MQRSSIQGPEAGVYAVVDVEDTGTGMTDEVKKKDIRPVFHHQAAG
jgi:hypothetical protein